MMSTETTAILSSTSPGAQSVGWIASLVLHATLVLGAIAFMQQMQLAPPQAPFKWNVAMVTPTAPPTANPSSQSAAPAVNPPEHLPTPHTLSGAASPPPPAPMIRPSAAPGPSESVAPERSAVRPIQPVLQPAPVESAAISPNGLRAESHSEIQEPVSDSPMALTPSQPITGQNILADSIKLDSASTPPVAAIAPVPSPAVRADYSWLSETILRRVEELKRYPSEARLDRAEGKVVLKAVIRGDGSIDGVEVFQSSGFRSLDHAAVELLKQAAPFQLPRPLGKSQMTVKIPMTYRLDP